MRRRLLWLACPWIMVIGACSPGIDEATPETTMEPSEESAAAAANDAVPPGVDLEFEVFGANLDEKGGDNPASIVAPVDWRQDASTFGFTFEPPGGLRPWAQLDVRGRKQLRWPLRTNRLGGTTHWP
ncbi:MAG: hypothetical protein IPF88_12655 [Candidatus Microthrix sp.]|nr:hypothetical protein [Candidatus Microthrix sp.]MBK6439415.1 hypothetical protein [Candidatus Microthrix sp.]